MTSRHPGPLDVSWLTPCKAGEFKELKVHIDYIASDIDLKDNTTKWWKPRTRMLSFHGKTLSLIHNAGIGKVLR
jgi:hypothetical protein